MARLLFALVGAGLLAGCASPTTGGGVTVAIHDDAFLVDDISGELFFIETEDGSYLRDGLRSWSSVSTGR